MRRALVSIVAGQRSSTDLLAARALAGAGDHRALIAAISEAPAAQPDVLDKIRDGKVQAAGAIIGQVMKSMGGGADAQRVRELILERAQG